MEECKTQVGRGQVWRGGAYVCVEGGGWGGGGGADANAAHSR